MHAISGTTYIELEADPGTELAANLAEILDCGDFAFVLKWNKLNAVAHLERVRLHLQIYLSIFKRYLLFKTHFFLYLI